jgi:hypothetical protein
MSMFIKDSDCVEVKIYYKQNGYKFLALTEKDIAERIKEKKLTGAQLKEDFEILTVQMSILSWGAYNELQDRASKLTAQGERYFDYKAYKEERLKTLVKSWSAKDDEGNPVPVTQDTVMELVPSIGDAIVKGYDEASFYDEDAEKK